MKIAVWGTGRTADEYMKRKAFHLNDEIVAFIDNNNSLWGKEFYGVRISAPDELEKIEFDRLLICIVQYEQIVEQIKKYIAIDYNKILTFFDLENEVKKVLIRKYENSSDVEIQNVLQYYNANRPNIYGYYKPRKTKKYPVLYEKDGMPYTVFEGKKMFYPKQFKFPQTDGLEYLGNILYEQGEHSPHKYIQPGYNMRRGMVIIDAGTCEGNFALRYVEEAKKIYLIESDAGWVEALERTFEPFKDKVVICNKFLSGEDTRDSITLDTLIEEKVDFIKMDVEGYEVDALAGGKRVLAESDAHCAICSYHKHGDEQRIREVLESYGYQTSTSEGYMFFPYDTYLELRRGIVYGSKQKGSKK